MNLLKPQTSYPQLPITPRSRTSMKQVPKLHQLNNSISFSTLLPGDKYFVQYNELYQLYQDLSGSQFVDLLTGLKRQFPQIVALNKNSKIMKRHQSQFLLQFEELLELYQTMSGQRFTQRLLKLSQLYENIVPLGRNVITEKNSKNGNFIQYSQLLQYYQKKDSYQFMRKLNSLIKQYPQIVPIDFNKQDIQDAQDQQNAFLQFDQIDQVYQQLSGNQFTRILSDLANEFPQMIPVGKVQLVSPEKKDKKDKKERSESCYEKSTVHQTASQVTQTQEIKQYKQILDMYFTLNGTKFVKRLNILHQNFPQIVPIGWNKQQAQNQHFLQYDALIDMYAQLSGAQFVQLMQGLIKQYPKIVPVGQENVQEEKIQICRFSQYGQILQLHSQLSGEQFTDMLKGLTKQYPQIISLNTKSHVNILHRNQKMSIVQFKDLLSLYEDVSGPQFRQILKKLKYQHPHIAPVCQDQKNEQNMNNQKHFESPIKLRTKKSQTDLNTIKNTIKNTQINSMTLNDNIKTENKFAKKVPSSNLSNINSISVNPYDGPKKGMNINNLRGINNMIKNQDDAQKAKIADNNINNNKNIKKINETYQIKMQPTPINTINNANKTIYKVNSNANTNTNTNNNNNNTSSNIKSSTNFYNNNIKNTTPIAQNNNSTGSGLTQSSNNFYSIHNYNKNNKISNSTNNSININNSIASSSTPYSIKRIK